MPLAGIQAGQHRSLRKVQTWTSSSSARRVFEGEGFIPIISDLTTLVGIGDIVAWGRDGIIVLECKNRRVPERLRTSGRLARQRERGERAEEYLATSHVSEDSGVVRAAIELDLDLPEPDWQAVERLVQDCLSSDVGVASLSLGPDDTLIACADDMDQAGLATVMPRRPTSGLPIMANYAELLEAADHRARAPSSYPIAADLRWRLLERKLLLCRYVDMAQLRAAFVEVGVEARLVPEHIDGMFYVRLECPDSEPVSFSPTLVEYCLWMPVPVAAMRDVLVTYARRLVIGAEPGEGLGSTIALADGDRFIYGMAYRGSTPFTSHG